ncbi:hypothetical protein [Kribbella sp. NPDC023855]|uniref:hypothetical protein n=1 Tax=Kribbella sp. NPDC023855 TaxID=3154698 RepID=UPI0033CC782C
MEAAARSADGPAGEELAADGWAWVGEANTGAAVSPWATGEAAGSGVAASVGWPVDGFANCSVVALVA